MDFDAANQKRDRRRRWSLLRLLDHARGQESGVAGRDVMDKLDEALPPADRFNEDDQHLLRLLKDLEAAGYAELVDLRTHRRQGYGLDYLRARVTAKGSRFCMGGEPPDALIDDGRIVRVDTP